MTRKAQRPAEQAPGSRLRSFLRRFRHRWPERARFGGRTIGRTAWPGARPRPELLPVPVDARRSVRRAGGHPWAGTTGGREWPGHG